MRCSHINLLLLRLLVLTEQVADSNSHNRICLDLQVLMLRLYWKTARRRTVTKHATSAEFAKLDVMEESPFASNARTGELRGNAPTPSQQSEAAQNAVSQPSCPPYILVLAN
jgi:hypothetical protein